MCGNLVNKHSLYIMIHDLFVTFKNVPLDVNLYHIRCAVFISNIFKSLVCRHCTHGGNPGRRQLVTELYTSIHICTYL